jgi:hypothetical protein
MHVTRNGRTNQAKLSCNEQAAREFTGQKFRWLEQIARDRQLPGLAAAVAIELCPTFNREQNGEGWKGQDTIARKLGVRREAVNRVLTAMVARGHLTSKRRGRNHTNLYSFILKDEAEPTRCAQARTSSGADDVRKSADDVREAEFRCAQTRTESLLGIHGGL